MLQERGGGSGQPTAHYWKAIRAEASGLQLWKREAREAADRLLPAPAGLQASIFQGGPQERPGGRLGPASAPRARRPSTPREGLEATQLRPGCYKALEVGGRPVELAERRMAADRVGRRLGRASSARSTGLSPGGSRAERTASPGIQRRQARVTVKYDRRELQRRLDTEKWIDGRLEDLYRGREDEMPDEVNIDDLLEMDTDEERAKKLQGTLESCHKNTEDFTRELLEKLRGLRTEHVLRRTSPSSQRNMDQGPKVPQ
uniref:Protein phosphatase 1 regulatory subunit 14A n=1 Tax=Laticauda laticaudata TaxID=8630 RepID=A0A8C5SGP4_LATLA